MIRYLKEPLKNVVQLDGKVNVRTRAEAVRAMLRMRLSDDEDTNLIGGIFVGITASGDIRTTVINIEPEFVTPLLREGRTIARRLKEFAESRLPATGTVVNLFDGEKPKEDSESATSVTPPVDSGYQ